MDFLCRVVEAVIEAGATTVNIPDTVGYATPSQIGCVIKNLMQRVPNIDKATVSIHCHDDLGLAVANSLAAIESGAGQIECTINGIGEPAGNCSLEEVVMALRTRNDYYHCDTHVRAEQLVPTSRLLCNITGMVVQRNKAIVGRNAFAHEAGIHQDGMLKERTTYEIMRPEDVGFIKTDLVLGKHSGRAALADRAKHLGYAVSSDQLKTIFDKFKQLADEKKEIYDGDIAALIEQELFGATESQWLLTEYEITAQAHLPGSLSLTLQRGKQQETTEVPLTSGPVAAAIQAVNNISGLQMTCRDYRARSLSSGTDCRFEVLVEAEDSGQSVGGKGQSSDLVHATLLAILSCLNRFELAHRAQHAQANGSSH